MAEFFKAENLKLKKKIEELEASLVNVMPTIRIVMPQDISAYIEALVSAPGKTMKIVTPEVDPFFAGLIIKAVKKGKKVRLVTRELTKERGKAMAPKSKQGTPENPIMAAFDKLKNTVGIDLVEFPHVSQLIIIGENQAFYSAGPLAQENFLKNNQMGFEVNEKGTIKQMQDVLTGYMPTFMR